MKKLLALTVAAAMTLSLAACGGNGSSTSEASSEAASSEATTSEAATSEGTEADAAGSSDFDATVLYYTYADTYISSVRTALDAEG